MDLPSLSIPFIILLIMISNNLPLIITSSCSISKCNTSSNLDIRFPFWIHNSNQPDSLCGYPGFEVSCDGSKRTLIELPSSGRFVVKNIDYAAQEIWVNDPNSCLPKALLTLNLSTSPFTGIYFQDFSFFNCSTNLISQNAPNLRGIIGPIPCLSSSNSFVFGLPQNYTTTTKLSLSRCSSISDVVNVPVQWPVSLHNHTGLSLVNGDDLRLTWFTPECRACELNGQMCGLNNNSSGSQVIACWNIPNSEKSGKLSLRTYLAVVIVICAPCILYVVASLVVWIRACYRRDPNPQLGHQASIVRPRPRPGPGPIPGQFVELGLQEAGVEFAREMARLGLYSELGPEVRPKIVMSEFEQAGPNPMEENICSICMAEYKPKDKIGTLPMCGHYFHANCINEWLRSLGFITRTCPICRARVTTS